MRVSSVPLIFGIAAGCVLLSGTAMAQWHYPPPPTSDASDVWHGKRYEDPYRPLENLTDPKIAAWFKAEAQLTDRTVAKIPGRDALVREWLSMDRRTPPRYREFQFEGGRLFYRKTLGGENVGKLYVREGWEGSERLLFDPTLYKQGGGTTVSLFVPSFDGQYVVLGLAVKGGEWSELRVLKVDDGQLLPDSIYPAAWFGVNWLPNSRGFFYNGSGVTDITAAALPTSRAWTSRPIAKPGSTRWEPRSARTATCSVRHQLRTSASRQRNFRWQSFRSPRRSASSAASIRCSRRIDSILPRCPILTTASSTGNPLHNAPTSSYAAQRSRPSGSTRSPPPTRRTTRWWARDSMPRTGSTRRL